MGKPPWKDRGKGTRSITLRTEASQPELGVYYRKAGGGPESVDGK